MFIRLQKPVIILSVLMLLSISITSMVSANSLEIDNSTIFINSRFILWDADEKMIDNKFNISIFYNNVTSNNTCYYKIDIDNNITEGFLNFSTKHEYKYNETLIHYITIYINNVTVFKVTNIITTSTITERSINYPGNPYTINLSPSEWNAKEINLFTAVIFGGFIASVMVYRIRIKYSKGRGITTYK